MKSLKESILSSNKADIISILKDNLKYCHNVIEFSRLWSKLSLDIEGFQWEYGSGGAYVYSLRGNNLILCIDVTDQSKYPCIFVYENDEFETKRDCLNYVKKVASKLKMNYVHNQTGWYELTFN